MKFKPSARALTRRQINIVWYIQVLLRVSEGDPLTLLTSAAALMCEQSGADAGLMLKEARFRYIFFT